MRDDAFMAEKLTMVRGARNVWNLLTDIWPRIMQDVVGGVRLSGGDMSQKLDLYKEHAAEYVAGKLPQLVQTQRAQYLTIEGAGDPAAKEFQDDVGALYAIAFTIKMAKKYAGHEYHMSRLEGLWSPPDEQGRFEWKLMIRTPEFIDQDDLRNAITVCQGRRHPKAEKVKLELLDEGTCVQALHVGPYTAEPETIRLMKETVAQEGYRVAGRHHEIYLSDPRRVRPERLRTIIRYPVEAA
jgi:hypothetical protein